MELYIVYVVLKSRKGEKMAKVFKKTLTVRGIEENARRFRDSLKQARYVLDGETVNMNFLKVLLEGDTVKIYLYFDDGVVGNITNVEVLDIEDGVIISTDDSFSKSEHKGFYILFKYQFVEGEI